MKKAIINILLVVFLGILIYSGYRIEELKARHDPAAQRALGLAAVLIDGAYIK